MRDMSARRRAPSTGEQGTATGEEAEADAFDLWLRVSLREAFDQVAAEPVPEDLLRMIEEDRAERERLRRRRRGLPE
jgi:hypothetical protein